MYRMNDYRVALSERDSQDMYSAAWNLAQLKVNGIVAVMVASGDREMVLEVVNEVHSLNDCGMEFENEAIQYDLWILESNGFKDEAQELRELAW